MDSRFRGNDATAYDRRLTLRVTAERELRHGFHPACIQTVSTAGFRMKVDNASSQERLGDGRIALRRRGSIVFAVASRIRPGAGQYADPAIRPKFQRPCRDRGGSIRRQWIRRQHQQRRRRTRTGVFYRPNALRHSELEISRRLNAVSSSTSICGIRGGLQLPGFPAPLRTDPTVRRLEPPMLTSISSARLIRPRFPILIILTKAS